MGILDDDEKGAAKEEVPHVTFRCPPEMYERLQRVVKSSGKSRTFVLLRFVKHGLDVAERELAEKKPKK